MKIPFLVLPLVPLEHTMVLVQTALQNLTLRDDFAPDDGNNGRLGGGRHPGAGPQQAPGIQRVVFGQYRAGLAVE